MTRVFQAEMILELKNITGKREQHHHAESYKCLAFIEGLIFAAEDNIGSRRVLTSSQDEELECA